MAEDFASAVTGGPVLLALAAAALAGLVSFLSPCVLPLVPGYLSYVTGLAGADAQRAGRRGRTLLGTSLFVLGFAAVFVPLAVLFGALGRFLADHQRALEAGAGTVIVALGLAFAGLLPGFTGAVPTRWLPDAGLAGAPVFGAVFALSWTPCVGPTLGAVLGLATTSGGAGRAALLAAAYCLGLGAPFVVFGLGLRGLLTRLRPHARHVARIGGALLVLVGLALVTGAWGDFTIWLRGTVGLGEVPL